MSKLPVFTCAALIATAIVWPNALKAAAEKARAAVSEIYLDAKLQEISKRQAMRVMLNDDKQVVLRCSQVELSEKMTIRKRK
jgi:hypothetical protein